MKLVTHTKQKGFTLLELILYITLATILLSAVSVLFSTVVFDQGKHRAIRETDENAARALRTLTEIVRNADSIDSPVASASDSTLSLTTKDGALNPTVISVADGVLEITEGASASVPLTPPDISVDSITFSNISNGGSSASLRIQMMLSFRSSGVGFYQYSNTYYATADTRK